LTIKTVPQIPYWKTIKSLYNLFLIGNSLILIFSFFTYQIVKQLREKQHLSYEWIIAIFMVIALNLITIIITHHTNEVDIELQKEKLGLLDKPKKT